jgi:diguanylate cyclase (GGDEF)-like protein
LTEASRRQMVYSAAAMYGGAALTTLVEGLVPGGPKFSPVPGIAAFGFVLLLLAVGRRLPMPALAALGPVGAALIAYALATTPPDQTDGALLYVWPVLWTTYFFGRTGAILIVAWVALVQAVALLSMTEGVFDRWVDVVVSVGVVAVVVHSLVRRNERLVARLAAEARVDKLTGVLNRRGFEERAAVEVERARRERDTVAAVTFDIDYFKRVNDEWGHEVGDRVLEHLGQVLRRESRGVDVVARLGGEEFVALLPRTEADEARGYAERVRGAFAHRGDGDLPDATLSAGVTAAPEPETVDALLQTADSALYAAKRGGRDRAVIHAPTLQATG